MDLVALLVGSSIEVQYGPSIIQNLRFTGSNNDFEVDSLSSGLWSGEVHSTSEKRNIVLEKNSVCILFCTDKLERNKPCVKLKLGNVREKNSTVEDR